MKSDRGHIVGIIAGSGRLPLLACEILRNIYEEVLIIDLVGDEGRFGDISFYYRINPGQVGKAIKILKKHIVKEVLFAGKVEKGRLFTDIKPDMRAVKLMSKMKLLDDKDIMIAIVRELEIEGIRTLHQTDVFEKFILKSKKLTPFRVPGRVKKDIECGLTIAKGIAELGLGQTVVVKDGVITAVETIEGTDETIKRGAIHSRGGFSVVKVAYKNQDTRFDLPAVGIDTLKLIIELGGVCLALERGFTIVIDRDEMLRIAEESKVHIVGV